MFFLPTDPHIGAHPSKRWAICNAVRVITLKPSRSRFIWGQTERADALRPDPTSAQNLPESRG